MNNEVIKVLEAAVCQDVNLIRLAEEKIKLWETVPGFPTVLLDVFLSRELNPSLRWIAVICLKNCVHTQWRGRKSIISEEEKRVIRSKVLTNFNETSPQLAMQQAVIIGKIARIDIQVWPECVQRTLEAIQTEDRQHQALLTLDCIINELASKRLMSDRKLFEQMASKTFRFLHTLSNSYYTQLKNDVGAYAQCYDACNLIAKVLRKLLVYGAKCYAPDSMQVNYLHDCFGNLSFLLSQHKVADGKVQSKIEKLIVAIMKVLLDSIEHQPLSFTPLLELSIILCLEQIFSSDNGTPFKTLLIYCGNLLRMITRSYKKPKGQLNTTLLNADVIKRKMLTESCVERLCDHIIFHFFTLTDRELEEWRNSPEEYCIVEAGESHKFLLGPCMETLYVGLFYEYRSVLVPKLLRCAEDIKSASMDSQDNTLRVCAVLKALGLASYELFDELDFDVFFTGTLLNMLDDQHSVLLHQHVIWLTGEWINVKFSQTNRVVLYKILQHYLRSEDVVLQVTSCRTLRTAIDDVEFDARAFSAVAREIFACHCALLRRVEACELKMCVLNVIGLLVERSGGECELNKLLGYLPHLWELSANHNLLRGAVVNVLTHVVKGLSRNCTQLYGLVLPIIDYSTSVDEPAHVYLLEDGLELWLSVVENSTDVSEEMLMLYKNIIALFDRASETLDVCLAITRNYLLIDASKFLMIFSSHLCETFSQLLTSIKELAAVKVAQLVKLSLWMSSRDAACWKNVFIHVISQVIDNTSCAPLISEYVTICATLCVQHPAYFNTLIAQFNSHEETVSRLLDVWLERIDCMSPNHRKATAVALCSMLPHRSKVVYDRFALILDACVNVLYEQRKHESPTPTEMFVTAKEIREHEALLKDPCHSIDMLTYTRAKLNECKQTYGEELFKNAMETLDTAVAKQLMSLIN